MEIKISALVMDVDGTLTDGKIYIGNDGEIMKAFSVKDGLRIKELAKHKIIPIIITGRKSQIVEKRCEELDIKHIYQNIEDKKSVLDSLLKELEIKYEEVAYIGDDINDLPCMEVCGFVGCPADAVDKVKSKANYICVANGGDGAVREFIEHITY